MNFKPFLVTILTLKMFISKSFGIFLPELFRGWISHTEEGCDGVCQLSLTCWFSGGRTSLDGDCNTSIQISLLHSFSVTFLPSIPVSLFTSISIILCLPRLFIVTSYLSLFLSLNLLSQYGIKSTLSLSLCR